MSDVTYKPFSFSDEDDTPLTIEQEVLSGAYQQLSKEDSEKEVAQKEENPEKDSLFPETTETPENTEESEETDLFSDSEEEEETTEKPVEVSADTVDYSAFKSYFIEKGIWADYEGSDKDLTEEEFIEMLEKQAKYKASEEVKEQVASLGEDANKLISFLKAGGDVKDYLSSFNQQLDILSLDVTTESGQESAIKTFYDSIGKSKEWISRYITRLKDEGAEALREEAEDAKMKLKEAVEEEQAELIKNQEEYRQEQELRAQAFNKAVRTSIYNDTNISDKEKKELDKFFFDHKNEDGKGNRYSEFYKRFVEIQRDPKSLIKLIRFTKDIDNFDSKSKVEKEVKNNVFKFIKGSSSEALSKAESQFPKKNQTTKAPPPLKF